MYSLDPIGNPSIVIPSIVYFPLVYVFKHTFSMLFDVVGKYCIGDVLFVDVSMILLSSLSLRPSSFASCLKVLQ